MPAGNELIVVVNGARLAIGHAAAPPDQRAALAVATARQAFSAIGIGARCHVVFQVEADKVAGFTLMPPQGRSRPVYTRWRGNDVMRRNLLTAFGCLVRRQPRVSAQHWPAFRGANAAGIADGKPTAVKWNARDRRERRVEDAGPRRRRFEPDRLGQPRLRLDRGQQRPEPGHPHRPVWRRRACERLVEAFLAARSRSTRRPARSSGTRSPTKAFRRPSAIRSPARHPRRR